MLFFPLLFCILNNLSSKFDSTVKTSKSFLLYFNYGKLEYLDSIIDLFKLLHSFILQCNNILNDIKQKELDRIEKEKQQNKN